MKFHEYHLEVDGERQLIIGQGNFSFKTVDDIARSLMASVPNLRLGVAMNEGSSAVTRTSGNDDALIEEAGKHANAIAAGHVFVAIIKNAFPINVLNSLMSVNGVCRVFAATANPVDVLIAETKLGRAVIGCVDGVSAKKGAVEDEAARKDRRSKLAKFGYSLG
jgi:hypothetical protein